MGRTFENRRLKMAKRGDRDAKAFTRCGRQIAMAVRAAGPDPDANPALRRAMQNARAANMPKDKVQNAIDTASGASDQANYEEVIYEGYGPHGIALIVVTATDNPTRTVANVRFAFKKEQGNLGTSGSVAFMFTQMGVFRLGGELEQDQEELELELIDHGLEQMQQGKGEKGEDQWVLYCARDSFGTLQSALETKGLKVDSSGFEWLAQTKTELSEEQEEDIVKLVDRLEQDDDVQAVFHNLA